MPAKCLSCLLIDFPLVGLSKRTSVYTVTYFDPFLSRLENKSIAYRTIAQSIGI